MGNSRSKSTHQQNKLKDIHDQSVNSIYQISQASPSSTQPSEPTESTPNKRLTKHALISMSNKILTSEIQTRTNSLSKKLNLDATACLLLLRQYQWNTDNILHAIQMWSNIDQILLGAGVQLHSKNNTNTNGCECRMCLKDTKLNQLYGLQCGHNVICKNCWIDYLKHAAQTKQCLFTTCPQFACNTIVQAHVFKLFLDPEYEHEYQRYLRFCRADFVEHTPGLCMCPWEGCEMVYKTNCDLRFIECSNCQHTFCIKCKGSPHQNMECINSWTESGDNILWIVTNTKACPKCQRRIQKNQGSIHMNCRRHAGGCGHEFCWLCLGNWAQHGSATGGYYQCNIYEKNSEQFVVIDAALMTYYKTYHNIHEKSSIDMIKCGMQTSYQHEQEFLLYQQAREWIHTLATDKTGNEYSYVHSTAEAQVVCEPNMKYFVNFNGMRCNIDLLFTGYSRQCCTKYMPSELIAFCISFYVDEIVSELSDEWDASSVVKHTQNKGTLGDILFADNDCRILEIRKDDFVTLITIKSRLKIWRNTVTRHVWNIKVSFLKDDAYNTVFFKLGLYLEDGDQQTKLTNGFAINVSDLNKFSAFESGDVVSILLINFDEAGLIKFGINGKILHNRTTICNMKPLNKAQVYRLQITLPENFKAQLL
eukprot:138372_1